MKRLCTLLLALLLVAFTAPGFAAECAVENVALQHNGLNIHLDKTTIKGQPGTKNILLVHGLTYSSHEFDVDYQDYSLTRYLAANGYTVWRLDIAGYGQSQPVKDGFMPNSDYAAEDINAAVDLILKQTKQDKIDVLGWSWGTVTSSRFAAKYPQKVRKLVLYAPILTGLVAQDVKNAFNKNTWPHAADDFQKTPNGEIDYAITDPAVVATYQSNCWRYDGESSPNGGRRDLLTDPKNPLIFPEKIKTPTLAIAGDKDPYINVPVFKTLEAKLPAGSQVVQIKGAAHAAMMEKPYYRHFRETVLAFLAK